MKSSIFTVIAVLSVALLAACSAQRSKYVIDEDKMEDVLYDVHRSHFLFEDDIKRRYDAAYQYALTQHVLKQHGVTKQQWDSSLVYYARNADVLSHIYERLEQRLDHEASMMGAGVSEFSDSTDIWRADRSIVLSTEEMFSSYQWRLPADSLLKPGEKVTLRCMVHFLNTEAQKRATLLLAIRLDTDTVISRYSVASQTGIYTTEITDDMAKGIKEVQGIFVLNHPVQSSFSTTSSGKQILSITDIKLLHEETVKKKELPQIAEKPIGNSLKVLNADSLNSASENMMGRRGEAEKEIDVKNVQKIETRITTP